MSTMVFRGSVFSVLTLVLLGCQGKSATSAQFAETTPSSPDSSAEVVATRDHPVVLARSAEPPRLADSNTTSRSASFNRSHPTSLSTTEIVSWSQHGISNETIIDRIERSGTVFRLTAADEMNLRDRGVNDSVIRALRETARR